jgi:hypothetical protein
MISPLWSKNYLAHTSPLPFVACPLKEEIRRKEPGFSPGDDVFYDASTGINHLGRDKCPYRKGSLDMDKG